MSDQAVIRLAVGERERIEKAAKSWAITTHRYIRLQATAPRADWPEVLEKTTQDDGQIGVGFGPGEKEIAERRANKAGVSLTRYVRLQALSPAADWRMHRVFVPAASAQQVLDLDPVDQLEQLPNGWFKLAGEPQWFWIEGVSDS